MIKNRYQTIRVLREDVERLRGECVDLFLKTNNLKRGDVPVSDTTMFRRLVRHYLDELGPTR